VGEIKRLSSFILKGQGRRGKPMKDTEPSASFELPPVVAIAF
jgi:hypothetical protein